MKDSKIFEESMPFHKEALSFCPPGHPDRPLCLDALACSLTAQYEQYGDTKDLDEAISFRREQLSQTSPNHPSRCYALVGLAKLWDHGLFELGISRSGKSQFHINGKPCLSARLTIPIVGLGILKDLVNSLSTRYEQSGSINDLEEAASLLRPMLDLSPPGQADRFMYLSNIATLYTRQYEGSGNLKKLDEVIVCQREALSLCPSGHPYRSMVLTNLAGSLMTREKQTGDIKDFEEATLLLGETLSLGPPGPPK